jgi:preprotein translocase subunit SecG
MTVYLTPSVAQTPPRTEVDSEGGFFLVGERSHMNTGTVLWLGFAESGIRNWLPPILNIVLLLVGLFLILLVLIQKGKGGGLAGAFGGSGGSSAFGSRAGDTFTRITIYVAAVWILLIMILIKLVQPTVGTPSDTGQIQSPIPPSPADDDVQ